MVVVVLVVVLLLLLLEVPAFSTSLCMFFVDPAFATPRLSSSPKRRRPVGSSRVRSILSNRSRSWRTAAFARYAPPPLLRPATPSAPFPVPRTLGGSGRLLAKFQHSPAAATPPYPAPVPANPFR